MLSQLHVAIITALLFVKLAEIFQFSSPPIIINGCRYCSEKNQFITVRKYCSSILTAHRSSNHNLHWRLNSFRL